MSRAKVEGMAATCLRRWTRSAVVLGVGVMMGGTPGWTQEAGQVPGRVVGRENSLGTQLNARSRNAFGAGSTIPEWQWNSTPHFVRLLGGAEPGALEQSVRLSLANQENSTVQVSFHAKAPEGGFPAGTFAGQKEISYTIERVFSRLEVRRGKVLTWGGGPFKLVASEPAGHTLAELSTLGGIARGQNMVLTVDEVFKGENTFAVTGRELTFVNGHFAGDTSHFPAQIVLAPVK